VTCSKWFCIVGIEGITARPLLGHQHQQVTLLAALGNAQTRQRNIITAITHPLTKTGWLSTAEMIFPSDGMLPPHTCCTSNAILLVLTAV
jgi:hypothetical protein